MNEQETYAQLILAKERNINILLSLFLATVIVAAAYLVMTKKPDLSTVEGKIDDNTLLLKDVVEVQAENVGFAIGDKVDAQGKELRAAIEALHCPKCKIGQQYPLAIAGKRKETALHSKFQKKLRHHKAHPKKTPQIAKKAAKGDEGELVLEPFVPDMSPENKARVDKIEKTLKSIDFNTKTGEIHVE